MEMMTMHSSKKEVRQKLLASLLALTKEEIKRRSEYVEHILSELPLYRKAKVIMVYFPLKGEVDLLGLVRKTWGTKVFCFPVMDLKTKGLRAFEVSNLERGFVRGPYGVMEPAIGTSKEINTGLIDLVLVPGLGFDRGRNRLGRGAGIYDRFLRTIKPPAQKAGIAFDLQIHENLPFDPLFDEKVDLVVTESSVI
jgi:5-formyltetrahydrofolate cyclo-ligase